MQERERSILDAKEEQNDLYRLARDEDNQFLRRHRNHPMMKHNRKKSFWGWFGRVLMGRSG